MLTFSGLQSGPNSKMRKRLMGFSALFRRFLSPPSRRARHGNDFRIYFAYLATDQPAPCVAYAGFSSVVISSARASPVGGLFLKSAACEPATMTRRRKTQETVIILKAASVKE